MSGKCSEIAALVMGVDRVLTDGTIILGDDGGETRGYNAHDGVGIGMLHKAGLPSIFCTGSGSRGVRRLADHVTCASGGAGAVREVCEMLLKHTKRTSSG